MDKEVLSSKEFLEIDLKLEKIRRYVKKFKDPSKFINKILESFQHPFYLIDAKTYE